MTYRPEHAVFYTKNGRWIYLCLIAVLGLAHAVSFASGRSIEGVWLSGDGDGWIEIKMLDEAHGGFIVGSPDDPENHGLARLDKHNPDPALRQRPLLGLHILRDLNKSGNNQWKGRIYDPNSGKTYRYTLTLVDQDTLKLRGYVGISLFGRTETWSRRKL